MLFVLKALNLHNTYFVTSLKQNMEHIALQKSHGEKRNEQPYKFPTQPYKFAWIS